MKTKGIDVSGYNNVRDYAAVAADGIEFAILRIISRDLRPDARFERHWRGFESAGIPVQGVYHYAYTGATAGLRSDAQRVLEVLAGRRGMVWLDIEDKSLQGQGGKLAVGIRVYADVIRSAGLPFGIYTNQSFYNRFLRAYADSLAYPFWVARYPSGATITPDKDPDSGKRPDIGQQLYGWQYSSRGKVGGIDGNVDLNEWYVNIEAQSKALTGSVGSYVENGFRQELAVALGLPAEAPAAEVLAHTVTVSSKVNRYHAAVTPLERLMREYGFYSGAIEADLGKHPNFGKGMAMATRQYQTQVTGLKNADGEWTAGNRSYAKALRID